MAAATNAATGRIEVGPTPYAAPASPITAATPRMISHSCLVCLPVATKACPGLVMASMKAHASTTNATRPSARKKYRSGVYASNTGSRYLIGGTGWSDLGYSLRILGFPGYFRLGGQDGFHHVAFRARRARDQFGRGALGLLGVFGALGPGRVLPAERLVDLHEHLLLPFGELRVGKQGGPDARVRRPVLEDPGLHIERFRGDAQALGDLLQDVRARLAQTTLDLAQVGVGHPGRLSQLAHRDLRLFSLLADVFADRVNCHVTHTLSLPPPACNCKRPASTPPSPPQSRHFTHIPPQSDSMSVAL